nr:MAG TPA: hypothetical protein [Caudoviricetes sp.]
MPRNLCCINSSIGFRVITTNLRRECDYTLCHLKFSLALVNAPGLAEVYTLIVNLSPVSVVNYSSL